MAETAVGPAVGSSVGPAESKESVEAPEQKAPGTQLPGEQLPNENQEEPTPAQAAIQGAIESIAAKLGWNKNHTGPDAVDAETFIMRSRDISSGLSKRVKSLSQKLESMDEGISAMKSFYQRTHEEKVSKLKSDIERLRSERDDAVEDGDKSKFKKLDKQIIDLEKQASLPLPMPNQNPKPPTQEYLDWAERNQWYESDNEMHQWADRYYQITPELQGAPQKRALEIITEKAKIIFPDKFEAPKEKTTVPNPSVPSVAPSTSRTKSKKKLTGEDLTYHQRQSAEKFINQGIFKDLDEYATELQKQNS